MEQRAAQVGVAGKLSYILSNGAGKAWPDPTQAKAAAALGLGSRLIWDIHVNGGGATDLAEYCFDNASYDTWAAMNLETNYGDHTVRRMLDEAQDLNRHFNYGNPRLLGRTASFCMERSGYQEGGLNDQGLIFFLPNMTWLQPPGYVHSMISETWQPVVRNVTLEGECGTLAAVGGMSAQSSDDGDSTVLRLVNAEARPLEVTLAFDYGDTATVASWRHISWKDLASANTPSQPRRIAPSEERRLHGSQLVLPGNSFAVVRAACRDGAPPAVVV